mmetsp:Transcript_5107/g.14570  ORF Transcript_5107/g.14570 Transcript_5107/m.14570 type:complete len:227 (+) Transcript_5107:612-1292(+)
MACLIGSTRGVPSNENTDVPISKPHVLDSKGSSLGPTPSLAILEKLYTATMHNPQRIKKSAPKIGYSKLCTVRIHESGINTINSKATNCTADMISNTPNDFAMSQMKMMNAMFVPNCETTSETCTANRPPRPAAAVAISPKLHVCNLSLQSSSKRMQSALSAATAHIANGEKSQPPKPKAPGKNMIPLPTNDFAVANVIACTDMVPAGAGTSSPSSPRYMPNTRSK